MSLKVVDRMKPTQVLGEITMENVFDFLSKRDGSIS